MGGWDGMDMYSVPSPVSYLPQTYHFPVPEGKEGLERHGVNVSRLVSECGLAGVDAQDGDAWRASIGSA